MYANGRRELFVLQRHVPTKKFIDEKFGFTAAGIGVVSTCAPAESGMASAVSDSQRKRQNYAS